MPRISRTIDRNVVISYINNVIRNLEGGEFYQNADEFLQILGLHLPPLILGIQNSMIDNKRMMDLCHNKTTEFIDRIESSDARSLECTAYNSTANDSTKVHRFESPSIIALLISNKLLEDQTRFVKMRIINSTTKGNKVVPPPYNAPAIQPPIDQSTPSTYTPTTVLVSAWTSVKPINPKFNEGSQDGLNHFLAGKVKLKSEQSISRIINSTQLALDMTNYFWSSIFVHHR